MPDYTKVFESRAQRGLTTVDVDLQAFFEDAEMLGMSAEAIEQELLDDLYSGGPIFGKFFNNLTGATEAAVMAAGRQGTFVGQIKGDEELQRLLAITDSDIDAMLEGADAEAMEYIEMAAGDLVRETWVAELLNTCDECLPLHGVTLTRAEWNSRGLAPETMHAGWNSVCHCQRIFEEYTAGRSDLIAPLVRNSVSTPTGLKGARRSVRAIAQRDIDKSLAAVAKSRETVKGRRTLRLLGQSNVVAPSELYPGAMQTTDPELERRRALKG